MSLNDEVTDEYVLGVDDQEILSTLGDELERSCQQLELDALHGAGELLRRETNALRSSRNMIEAQQRAEFVQRLSSIVTDACCKLEAKMHVSSLHIHYTCLCFYCLCLYSGWFVCLCVGHVPSYK